MDGGAELMADSSAALDALTLLMRDRERPIVLGVRETKGLAGLLGLLSAQLKQGETHLRTSPFPPSSS